MRAKLESLTISWKLRVSNLIVLVESEIEHETFNMKTEQFFKKKLLE